LRVKRSGWRRRIWHSYFRPLRRTSPFTSRISFRKGS